MDISIFRNNILLVNVKPDDSSELSQKKQLEDVVRLSFVLQNLIEFKIGDYLILKKNSQVYRLNKKPRITESPKNYKYECIFEGPIHDLKKTKCFLITQKTEGFYKDYKFPLTGRANDFLQFIVGNLNRNMETPLYTVGKCVSTDIQTMQFNNWNVFEAITSLSNTFQFSWYLDGYVLNFDEKGFDTTYLFRVGRLQGLVELTRFRADNEEVQTVVYGYGLTDNLPPRIADEGVTYDSPLLMENRLAFVGVDGESKLENNVNLYGRIETVQEFDVKPERIGGVTAIDSTNLRIFYDDTIDFDIEQQKIPGIPPKIVFLSGALMGTTFNISFEYATKKITVDYATDETGTYPNEFIKIGITDSYSLIDVILPQSYINTAQDKLQALTEAYLQKSSKGLDIFEAKIDPFYMKSNHYVLNLGDLVRIVSGVFAIDDLYEIKELVQNINDNSRYTIKFGDVLPKGLLTSLKLANFAVKQEVYNIQRNTYTINEVTNQNTTIIEGEELQWQDL